jgi:hypothetical protein
MHLSMRHCFLQEKRDELLSRDDASESAPYLNHIVYFFDTPKNNLRIFINQYCKSEVIEYT